MALLSLSEGSCKSSLFKTFTGRYLPDHVMTTVVVTSQLECSMLCAREDNCESWNLYEAHSGLMCELNNGTELVENSLLKRDGAKFGHRLDIQVKEKVTAARSTQPKASILPSLAFVNMLKQTYQFHQVATSLLKPGLLQLVNSLQTCYNLLNQLATSLLTTCNRLDNASCCHWLVDQVCCKICQQTFKTRIF